MKSREILRIFFFALFALICFAQCYTILKSFLEYPTIINMYDVSPSLITILPGITICNNNRFSLKKLAERNLTIRQALESKFPGWYESQPSLVDKRKFNRFRDELAKIYERLNYNPQDELDNATMRRHFDIKPESKPFIKWLDCGRTWTDSIECGNLTQIDSVRSRACTTILHQGAMLYDLINRPELFNVSRAPISSHYSYFDAKEVIKILIDFEPEDYADLKRQIGARITFHDSNMVASSGDLDFFITRGYRYDFNIDRRDTKLLDKPYGDCWNYELNLNQYKIRVNPRIPLSGSTCFQNCVIRNIIHRYKCWPPTMPYYRNDSLDPEQEIRPCSWFLGSHHISIFEELLRFDEIKRRQRLNITTNSTNPNDTISRRPNYSRSMRIYKKIRRFCALSCVVSCQVTEFTVTVTRSSWPSDVSILFDKDGKQSSSRHCCALMAIKFTHFHYNVDEYRPKYDVANTIGDIGGLLAVWLGLSIVSVYHAFQKLIEFCTRRSREAHIKVKSLKPRG